MLRVRFELLVFQGRRMVGEVNTCEHEFANAKELATAMAGFAAMNSAVKTYPETRHLLQTKIQEPSIPEGIGPDTTLLINEVIVEELVPAEA